MYLYEFKSMKAFNYITILLALLGIIETAFPDVVVALSSERVCRNAVKLKLKEADFGSRGANIAKPIIIGFAEPELMEMIKDVNQGNISQEDIPDRIKDDMSNHSFFINNPFKIPINREKVSAEVSKEIRPLLKKECKGVS